jgi:hypothetical protein
MRQEGSLIECVVDHEAGMVPLRNEQDQGKDH